MAVSLRRAFAVAACICAAACVRAAESSGCTQPIELNSSGASEFDFRTGKTIMHDVAISQCDVSITADLAEATSLDSKDSRWLFSGNVHIEAEQRGTMRSERAEVEFRDNRIDRATIRGNPAQFEQKGAASQQTARGRAREIVYQVGAGTVRFAHDAWLSNGGNELSGPLCVYNIRQRKVHCEGGSRITIAPKRPVAPAAPATEPGKPEEGEPQ